MVIVLPAIGTSKHRNFIRYGIKFVLPMVFVIYILISLMNFSLFISILGINVVRYEISIFSSIGITVLITIFYFISRIYPKNSDGRKVILLTISLLFLIDGIIWAGLGLIMVMIEGGGLILVDITPILMGSNVILFLNVVLNGITLFINKK